MRSIDVEIIQVDFDHSSLLLYRAHDQVDLNQEVGRLAMDEKFGCVGKGQFAINKCAVFAVAEMLLVLPDLDVKFYTFFDSQAYLVHFQ